MEGITGEVRWFVGSRPPRGWAFCKGQVLGRVAYASLYEEIGHKFGGDGKTHFQLPDLANPLDSVSATYIICISGMSPRNDMQWHLGEITLFAGKTKPKAKLACHGQRLDVDDYMPLFSVIGHRFGGEENAFCLPDLTGKQPHAEIQYWMNVSGEFPI